jgi:hypothetical protein
MTSAVIDVHECGAAVQWTHSLDRKIDRFSAVSGDLVSGHYQCAQTTTLHRFVGHRTNAHAICVKGKLTTAPMLLICNQLASPFDNLDFEWFGQRKPPANAGRWAGEKKPRHVVAMSRPGTRCWPTPVTYGTKEATDDGPGLSTS